MGMGCPSVARARCMGSRRRGMGGHCMGARTRHETDSGGLALSRQRSCTELPRAVYLFYDEQHAYLAAAGVDGVKVDEQCILETLGAGHGGRVQLTRQYHQALDASIAKKTSRRTASSPA